MGRRPRGAVRRRFAWLIFRTLPSTAARLRWLGQNLFPEADYMRRKYDFQHLWWLPWFYGVRSAWNVVRARGMCSAENVVQQVVGHQSDSGSFVGYHWV
jgi:hypothetical protein